MKTLNKYRKTYTFNILASEANDIAIISAKFGKDLIGCAKTSNDGRFYTIRVIAENGDLVDHEVVVDFDNVQILKTEVIVRRRSV